MGKCVFMPSFMQRSKFKPGTVEKNSPSTIAQPARIELTKVNFKVNYGEFLSTVPSLNFGMCNISTRIKARLSSRNYSHLVRCY